jgi:hypothetical protein
VAKEPTDEELLAAVAAGVIEEELDVDAATPPEGNDQ